MLVVEKVVLFVRAETEAYRPKALTSLVLQLHMRATLLVYQRESVI